MRVKKGKQLNALRYTLARILSSMDLAMLGRRICMFVHDIDPELLKEDEIEKLAIRHAMQLLEECAESTQDIVTRARSERALSMFMLKTEGNVHISLKWELQNGVSIGYNADSSHEPEYKEQAAIILKKIGYEAS